MDFIVIYPTINTDAGEIKLCKMDISDSRTGIEISSVILCDLTYTSPSTGDKWHFWS